MATMTDKGLNQTGLGDLAMAGVAFDRGWRCSWSELIHIGRRGCEDGRYTSDGVRVLAHWARVKLGLC